MPSQHMFHNSQNTLITGGTFTQVHGARSALDILLEKAAPGAFYDSRERYDAPKCHPNTRTAVLEDVLDQIKIAAVSCILWLYGAAGAGKSSIAQTIAETCGNDGLLIGSFFFFRTAPTRNNASRLAASLAYQLARSIPETLQYISDYIVSDPAIFESSLVTQLRRLFIDPLRRACENNRISSPRPRLVILDGLDECDEPMAQEHVLMALAKVLLLSPIPIVVFIASRPEVHISSIFESNDDLLQVQSSHIGLNDTYDADADIRLFTSDKFKQIRRTHRNRAYLPPDWPTREAIEIIVQRSSGQFIFASTISKYIESRRHKPHERLDAALLSASHSESKFGDSPFKELDALYYHIFSGIEEADRALTLSILHLALGLDNSTPFTRHPLTIEKRLRLSAGDVDITIGSVASLVRYEGDNVPIRIFHATLEEFLNDKCRSKEFWIAQPLVKSFLTKTYLRQALEGNPGAVIPASSHLSVEILDNDTCDLLARLGTEFIVFVPAFVSAPSLSMGAHWMDSDDDVYSIPTDIDDLVAAMYLIHEKVENDRILDTFWTPFLHAVFRAELGDVVTSENAHQILVLKFFTRPEVSRLPGAFADRMGLNDDGSWQEFEELWLFALFSEHRQYLVGAQEDARTPLSVSVAAVLRAFLLDSEQSGNLSVAPHCFADVALRCVVLIRAVGRDVHILPGVSLSQNYIEIYLYGWNNWRHHVDEAAESYIWSMFTLACLLPLSPFSPQLLEALEGLEYQLVRLEHHPILREHFEKAVDAYINTHRSVAKIGNLRS